MESSDYNRFSEWFDVLAVTHRLQASDDLRGKMKAEYFDVLRSYPMDAVASAYQTLRRRMKRWPVPADWTEALPPFASVERLTQATPEEISESEAAEALGYEQEQVCKCAICVAADCFMPPRFVPRLDYQGRVIERRHPQRSGRALILGRWIHGEELKSWYRARAEFYQKLKAIKDIDLRESRRSKPLETRIENLAKEARLRIIENEAPPPPLEGFEPAYRPPHNSE